jgi:putative tryptophan/tyrosine transport system substrate-binding protein
MRRRDFITLLGGAAASPLVARAQQAPVPVVGFLSSRSPEEAAVHTAAFRRGLTEAGFVDGQNVAIAFRWAEGRYERLPALAKELVDLRVSVILAGGGELSARAAKDATASIPVVFVIGDDPVKVGLTASFNRPGGNLTGVSFLTGELGGKRLGLICELVPGTSAVALLLNPKDMGAELQKQDVQAAAQALGRRLLVLYARSETDFETNFDTLKREQVGALVVENDPFFDSQREKIMSLAARYAVPAIYHIREFPVDGGLMSYGARRRLSPDWELYGADSQRGEARRFARHAADQIRTPDKPQDRQGTRTHSVAFASCPCRRGDRMMPVTSGVGTKRSCRCFHRKPRYEGGERI